MPLSIFSIASTEFPFLGGSGAILRGSVNYLCGRDGRVENFDGGWRKIEQRDTSKQITSLFKVMSLSSNCKFV